MKIFAVLMAGGVGTRFWPRSRARKPKQILNIADEQTMIQASYNRLNGVVDSNHVFVVTNKDQADEIKKQLPEIPEENFIIEPFGRNTAPCIGLAALHIQQIDVDGVMLVLPADHLISNEPEFRRVVDEAAQFVAENGGLLTMGINPTHPATGYGYIQKGKKIADFDSHEIAEVKAFAEKPNMETAERFLESGDFFWNSGMFVWKASTILEEIEDKLPELHEGLVDIRKNISDDNYSNTLCDVYKRIRSISIDYGVMQSAQRVFVIPTDMGWNDVGSWEVVYDISEKDKYGNAGIAQEIVSVGSEGNYVYSPEKLVALVGVQDFIYVDTGDAVLICAKERSQDVKIIVEQLMKSGMDEYI